MDGWNQSEIIALGIGLITFCTVIFGVLAFYVKATISGQGSAISDPIVAQVKDLAGVNERQHQEIRSEVAKLADTATTNREAIAHIRGQLDARTAAGERWAKHDDTGERRRWDDRLE